MHTFGRANWRLPEWLNRRLPHLDIEEDVLEAPARDQEREVPVPV
jgi:RND superfamily putative drug exporter